MTKNNIPSRAELIQQTLNTRRYRDNNLFDEQQNPYFWKLSELAILYPGIFDIKKPVSQKTANKITSEIIESVPEFIQLPETPIHILTVKESYNLFDPEMNKIKTVKSGNNQNMTNVACEYLFRQQPGAELEQAYFMYPAKPATELTNIAQDLKFERIRNQIAQTSNLLAAIINRAHGANKSSFSQIWSLIWETLYKVKTMDELRFDYNIKTSPIDYMKPRTLTFINAMLQEIVFNFANKPFYTLSDIRQNILAKTAMARAKFIKYGSTPEKQLTDKSTYSIIEKIRRDRKRFWRENYPLSLKTR